MNNKKMEPTAPISRTSNSNDEMQFYTLYVQLVSAMTDIEKVDAQRVGQLLCDIAAMFRLSKGVTRVYRNPQEEEEGGGETLCHYDTGKEGKVVSFIRVVTSVMSIVTMTVYMSPDEEPLTEEEQWKVELVMRTTLSFVSRSRLGEIVEELACFDEAGYPNLRNLNNYLVRMINDGKIYGKAAFRYNLRHFALINHEFGREAGNAIIKEHYSTIKKLSGQEGFVARLGGDDFIGLCESNDLEKILDYLSGAKIAVGESSYVNLQSSVGVFVVSEDYEITSPSDVLDRIISAYNYARGGGKDKIFFFDDSIVSRKARSMRVQQLFPDALAAKEFCAYYQPKVNVFTGELEGAEALCRWFHEGSMIFPGDFIPTLEETNDICRLDLYMLEMVCRDIRRWLDEGRRVVRISVNFSRKNVMNAKLAGVIKEIADRYEVPHEYIEIELTETTSDVEFYDLREIVSELHESGFYTAVDDFGVGLSSLNLLKNIPWNVIKIDKDFLPEGNDDEGGVQYIMFRNVVTLIRQLGLDCISEGVETMQQVHILRENHCDLAQGFYFDRPLPVQEFEKRMDQKNYEIEEMARG